MSEPLQRPHQSHYSLGLNHTSPLPTIIKSHAPELSFVWGWLLCSILLAVHGLSVVPMEDMERFQSSPLSFHRDTSRHSFRTLGTERQWCHTQTSKQLDSHKKKKGAKSIRLHSVHKDKRCNQVTARAQPKSQKKPKGSNIQAISPTAKVAWHREGRPPSFPVSHTLWAPLSLHSGPKESTPLGTANCIMTRFSIRVGRDWSAHYVWFNLYSHANFFLDEADSTSKEFTILGHSRAIRTRLKHTV